jgi:hypothetical protein
MKTKYRHINFAEITADYKNSYVCKNNRTGDVLGKDW